MLSPPKCPRTPFCARNFLPSSPCRPEIPAEDGPDSVEGALNYGRLARSHEHSPGVAIPGSESGHAVQIRRGAENPRLQAGQPLALQKVEAGPVDGREVEPDGVERQEETEGGCQGRRATVKAGTCLDSGRRRSWGWMWGPRALKRGE